MNKVFKIIWNKAKQMYVVVPEFAYTNGKMATKAVFTALLVVGVMTTSTTNAADVHYYSVNSSEQSTGSNYANDGATGENALAAGVSVSAIGDSSIAVGDSARALGNRSQASGSGAVAGATLTLQEKKDAIFSSTLLSTLQKDSIETVINNAATDEALDTVIDGLPADIRAREVLDRATGADSIANGTNATTKSARSIAYGTEATVGVDSTNSMAFGKESTVSDYSPNAVAYGTEATIGTKSAGSIAIGYGASVANNTADAIALGSNSVATRSAADLNGTDPAYSSHYDRYNDLANTATYGEANIGGRVLGGVAAGRANDDAVNVGQWKSTALNVQTDDGADNITLWDESLTFAGKNGISTRIEDGKVVIDGYDLQTEIASKTVEVKSNRNNTIVTSDVETDEDDNITKTIYNVSAAGVVSGTNTVVEAIYDNYESDGVTPTSDAKIIDYKINAIDTNTAQNDVTTISGSKDSNGVMTITQISRQDTMTDGVWTQGAETITKIQGIASTDYVDNADQILQNQLYAAQRALDNNSQRISKLDSKVNKVGAGAAALAALHPLDFDPDDKLQFSAGMGNYAGRNAAAIGMFYRPDEKILFSVGGTVGNNENMVNAGVTFSLDRTPRQTNSKTAMAKEILDLKASNARLEAQVAKQDAQIAQLVQMMNAFAGDNMQYHVSSDLLSPDVGKNNR